jgi:pimeloyl-ACP methyl ester carboxylesterase
VKCSQVADTPGPARSGITPPEITGNWLPGLLRGTRHVVIPDGPHAIIWTHADEVNQALLDFIGASPGNDGA